MAKPTVRIVPRADTAHVVTDILIAFQGQHFASRVPGVIADTPENRMYEAAAFLRREAKRETT